MSNVFVLELMDQTQATSNACYAVQQIDIQHKAMKRMVAHITAHEYKDKETIDHGSMIIPSLECGLKVGMSQLRRRNYYQDRQLLVLRFRS